MGVTGVSLILPSDTNGCNNSDDHSQTHSKAEADLLNLSHLQGSGHQPWKGCKDEIHDDVVNISSLFKVVSEFRTDAKVESIPLLIAVLAADLGPLEDALERHPDVH